MRFIKQLSLNGLCKELACPRHCWLMNRYSLLLGIFFLVSTGCFISRELFPGFVEWLQTKCSLPTTHKEGPPETFLSAPPVIISWKVTERRAPGLVRVSVPISAHSHIPSLYVIPSSLHHFESQFKWENYPSLWVKQLTRTHLRWWR